MELKIKQNSEGILLTALEADQLSKKANILKFIDPELSLEDKIKINAGFGYTQVMWNDKSEELIDKLRLLGYHVNEHLEGILICWDVDSYIDFTYCFAYEAKI